MTSPTQSKNTSDILIDFADAPKGRGLWSTAFVRLRRNKAAVTAGILLSLITLSAIFASVIAQHPLDEVYFDHIEEAPSFLHWFGTDSNGRDLFVRVLYGAQISLSIGILASTVSLIIGVAYGAISGYFGGWVDQIMMRFVDILYSMPFMFFVILLMVILGRHFILIFIALGAIEWLTMARIVRGQTLTLRRREFVEAAHATGVSNLTIIRRHIVPNLLGPVIIYLTLTIPQVILTESFLSFLGLGVQEPMTSWGILISEGARVMESAPWMLCFPALILAVTLYCFNFLGDGLRDALDPKDR